MTTAKILLSENSQTTLTDKDTICKPKKSPQFIAAKIATISALCMGMCLAWTSSAIPLLKNHPNPNLRITDTQGAWIGSLITLGACLGAIPTGTIATTLGRKRSLQLFSIPLIGSWLLIAFSGCIYGLYLARFIAGLAIGAISVAAPMYVAELAHKSIRGTLGTFFQVQITIGLLLEYILGGTIHDFKLLALLSAALPVVFLIGFTFIPEAPVYLYGKGHVNKARNALQWFRGNDYDIEDELDCIDVHIKEENLNKAQFSDFVKCKANLKALIISLGLMIFQQLSGINAVLFYAGEIFSDTGSTLSPDICAILIGLVQVLATLKSTFLIDKAGRKILLITSASVMSLCLLILGLFFYLKQYHDLSHLSIIPLIGLAIYIIVFSLGFGPIPWMMIGEIFNPKMKGLAGSISASINWILAFTVTNQFQNMMKVFGTGVTFGIFGIICGIGALFVVLLVPETKGKSIEEVRSILLGEQQQYIECKKKTSQNTTIV